MADEIEDIVTRTVGGQVQSQVEYRRRGMSRCLPVVIACLGRISGMQLGSIDGRVDSTIEESAAQRLTCEMPVFLSVDHVPLRSQPQRCCGPLPATAPVARTPCPGSPP